jgi:biotin transport system substrate-specific component
MPNGMSQARRAAALEVLTAPWARSSAGVITFALLTAVGAYAQVRVPGLPVPVTLQTLVVSLAGALLGARLGALSQAAYLLAGALGAPVFAGGMAGFVHLIGPTGGYLLAFPLAAAVTGWLTSRWVAAPGPFAVAQLALGILLGTFVVFIGGAAQLALLTGDPANAVRVGVLPFLAGDALKVAVATLVVRRWGVRARKLF